MTATPDPDRQARLRALPSVDELIRAVAARGALDAPHALVAAECRKTLTAMRAEILSSCGTVSLEGLVARVEQALAELARPSLRRVLNASGVILHTNLGRAPLSAAAVDAVGRTAAGYANLEYDLALGRRGKRDVHAGRLLERLLGAPAIVVNNNAAAIFLVLAELARGGEALVSRGELVEIGDGFRIPDILEQSGARLREVGATNRTRIEDFSEAIGEETRVILRVHPSNFKIVGFTGRPARAELVALARERAIPLIEDLGSGCLYDLAQHGLEEEPPVAAALAEGVDLVTFSGDKLLGGPQAGVIAGRPDLVARIRRHPLFRALRADKMVYAALEATLREYLFERWDQVPALRMIRLSAEQVRERAEAFAAALGAGAEVVEGESLLGGGSTPEQTLPTALVRILLSAAGARSASSLDRRLRLGDPPVTARVADDALLLDLRTVEPADDEMLLSALRAALA
ncbi:MAG: L-seryl-tRNA(Sec) selenium transferase [Bryobacterales bacterium]|nr:L-seryl-tRNA(Sec) selenium transferase [Bryobacterales bacterium]